MKFKFLNLGQRIKLFVNGVLAQVNTYYDDTDTITAEKQNVDNLGEPFDEVQYQGFKTVPGAPELKSNVAKIIVNFPPDKTGSPSSANQNITILNNEQIDIVDHIPYNASVDRLKIISFDNIGNLSYNGNTLFTSKEFMQYDFEKIKFKSGVSGSGNPYQTIKYQVGNNLGYNATTYSLNINIDGSGLASIIEEDDPLFVYEGLTNKSWDYSLKIKEGPIGKTAKFSVECTIPEEVYSFSDNNISVSCRNGIVEIENNGTIEITTTLDLNGEDEILFQLQIFEGNTNIDGIITFVLIEVDGDPLLVSPVNSQTLTLTAI